MKKMFASSIPLPSFPLWDKMKRNRAIFSFDFELTARCNLNCRHCYINLPADDKNAKKRELLCEEISNIADEAASLGAVWCLISGGEPLLREDFCDIYIALKKKGFLISIYTNATLLNKNHVDLFKKYPPRDIEITVYGVTSETYEKVTRKQGSYADFKRGLDLLLANNIKVRLKAMALRSNIHELGAIKRFCVNKTKDYFRFDPFLNLRIDRNERRNRTIIAERLSPEGIRDIEQSDPERFTALKNNCETLFNPAFAEIACDHLFRCGAGNNNFALSYDGHFRLCSLLVHKDCVYDLKKGSLTDAWNNFVPQVREIRSLNREYLSRCQKCPLKNLCMMCPAQAYLETGEMDRHVDYFCKIAYARVEMLKHAKKVDKSIFMH